MRIEQRQGLQVGGPEEIAWRMGFIDNAKLAALAQTLAKTSYGVYLINDRSGLGRCQPDQTDFAPRYPRFVSCLQIAAAS